MFVLFLIFIIMITCNQVDSAASKMPKQFIRCHKNDTAINDCLKNAIQKALPVLAKGLPRLGVNPIDPLLTTRAVMEQRYGPVNLIVDFHNFSAAGFSSSKILRARSNVDGYKVGADVFTKHITIIGKYIVDGKVFILPLQGDGTFKFTLEDVRTSLDVSGEKMMKNGTRHMKVKRFDVNLNPRFITFQLNNLFGGNQFLGDRANEFLNENSRDIFRELKPTAEATLGLIFGELAKRFYDKVPYDEIYL